MAVNESLQRRHVDTLDTDELIAVVAPSARRAHIDQRPDAPTLGALWSASAAPNGATWTTLARVTRPTTASPGARSPAPSRSVGRSPGRCARSHRTSTRSPSPLLRRRPGAAPPPQGSFAAAVLDRTEAARLSALATAATSLWVAQAATAGAPDALALQVTTLASTEVFSAGPASVAAAIGSAASGAAVLEALAQDRLGAPVLTAVGAAAATSDVVAGVDGLRIAPERVTSLLRGATDAAAALRRRVGAAVTRGRGAGDGDAAPPSTPLDPVLLTPDVPTPMALALVERDPDWFLPGLGAFPPDRATLLTPDSSFAEAVLVGANVELLAEMVWREFPTDQRGTPIRRFWPRPDGAVDIEPIHRWADSMGTHLRIDHSNTAVILIRAELLRRYPSTVVLATPAGIKEGTNPRQLVPTGQLGQWAEPMFVVPIDAATRALAFAIPPAELRRPVDVDHPGWFFVFVEPPHSLRFGFDLEGAAPPATSDDVAWPHVLDPTRPFAVATRDVGLPSDGGQPVWGGAGACAADVARITVQKPVLLALHSSRMVDAAA